METQKVNTQVIKYVKETSKHLFVTEDKKSFFKVFHTVVNDKNIAVQIVFNEKHCSIDTYDLDNLYIDSSVQPLINAGKIESVNKILKHEFKHQCLFTDWSPNKHAIKNFKLMKEKVAKVEELVQLFYGDGKLNDAIAAELDFSPKASE